MPDTEIRAKFTEFCERFSHQFWTGPFFHDPLQTVALGQALGQDAPPTWELWLEKAGVPDSWGRVLVGAPLRAAIRLDPEDAANVSFEHLMRMVVAAIAGIEAHEALEFARFDGLYAVDPHGSAAELKHIGGLITEYLSNAARMM